MHFITIYAREAHPIPGGRAGQYSYDAAGNPVARPETYEERVALASKAVSEAGIAMPVLVDEIDNPLWCSYGQMPNNAFFIGQDGRIILYQNWNKTAEMEVAITAWLTRNRAAEESQPSVTVAGNVTIIHDVVYGSGGGLPLLLDIYIPEIPRSNPMPAIVQIHGGGWRNGDKYPSSVKTLAQQGFFGVSINYRLSGEANFPAAVEDCKCAVRWLRANAAEYNVDPDRIGVWGGSAGGHLVLMAALADKSAGLEGNGGWTGVSSRVQAVCAYNGPTEMASLYDFKVGGYDSGTLPAFLGGTLAEIPDVYRQASPLSYVSADDPPLLMVHGEHDKVVPCNQSELLLAAYREAGLEATLVTVTNAGHGFKPVSDDTPISPSRSEINQFVLDFFIRHLAGE